MTASTLQDIKWTLIGIIDYPIACRLLELARMTGYVRLTALERTETPWFLSANREYGLWWLECHMGVLSLSIVGPFRRRKLEER